MKNEAPWQKSTNEKTKVDNKKQFDEIKTHNIE